MDFVKREGQDDFWLNIGAAFMHQDGDGFNVVLQALPLNGKIVLRPPKAQSDELQEAAWAGPTCSLSRTAAESKGFLNFQFVSRLRQKLSPATHVRGAFL